MDSLKFWVLIVVVVAVLEAPLFALFEYWPNAVPYVIGGFALVWVVSAIVDPFVDASRARWEANKVVDHLIGIHGDSFNPLMCLTGHGYGMGIPSVAMTYAMQDGDRVIVGRLSVQFTTRLFRRSEVYFYDHWFRELRSSEVEPGALGLTDDPTLRKGVTSRSGLSDFIDAAPDPWLYVVRPEAKHLAPPRKCRDGTGTNAFVEQFSETVLGILEFSVDEAKVFAAEWGIAVPADVLIQKVSWLDREQEWAQWARVTGSTQVSWSDFTNKDGNIAIKVNPIVFKSRLLVLAYFRRALFEIESVRKLLAECGSISAKDAFWMLKDREGSLCVEGRQQYDAMLRRYQESI